jgi:predicted DNA-binding transcriptional regulator AlpA
MSSKSIPQFCNAHGFSRSFFYKLDKLGKAPSTMKVGALTRISDEAEREWVRRMEAETAASHCAAVS